MTKGTGVLHLEVPFHFFDIASIRHHARDRVETEPQLLNQEHIALRENNRQTTETKK